MIIREKFSEVIGILRARFKVSKERNSDNLQDAYVEPRTNEPRFSSKIRLGIYVALLSIVIFITSMLTTRVISSYYEKRETERQIETMQSFISEWHEKNNKLNSEDMRPVKADQVDMVQTDVIFRLQALGVNINTIKELKQQETDGRVFSVEFSGQYEPVMKSVKSLQESDALVGLKHIVLQSKDGSISAKLTYKIYTK